MSAALFGLAFHAGALVLAALGGAILGVRWHRGQLRRDGHVLAYLSAAGESYAIPMVEHGIDGRGTIYVRLARLEEEGLIVSREEPGIPRRNHLPRRLYRLAPAGAARHLAELLQVFQQSDDADNRQAVALALARFQETAAREHPATRAERC